MCYARAMFSGTKVGWKKAKRDQTKKWHQSLTVVDHLIEICVVVING